MWGLVWPQFNGFKAGRSIQRNANTRHITLIAPAWIEFIEGFFADIDEGREFPCGVGIAMHSIIGIPVEEADFPCVFNRTEYRIVGDSDSLPRTDKPCAGEFQRTVGIAYPNRAAIFLKERLKAAIFFEDNCSSCILLCIG